VYQINLSPRTADKLLSQDPTREKRGGFQKLAITLQRNLDMKTRVLKVSASDLEKIERYRTRYGQGGWQDLFDEIMKQTPN
jgi:hypothetical protein